jgi:hypothetical protein
VTHILLTGAGFTRNWGAWLASEAFEYLLGCPDVDDELRRELWTDQNKGSGFESTLGRLQQEASTRPAKQNLFNMLTRALVGMFNTMDLGLKGRDFEFQNDMRYQLGPFLARFDAIFTLNQDLFLERKYEPGMALYNPRRWSGFASPGLTGPAQPPSYDHDSAVTGRRMPLLPTAFAVAPSIQPYFKLHGSSNWHDAAGGRVLIMGGNKTATIQNTALLRWYADQFDQYLQRGARLMVIGYSFSDPHINKSIMDATKRGLRVFIIDPQGSAILDKRPGLLKPAQDELMGSIQPALIGASRRPLMTTFGGDIVEHQRVVTFFNW